MSRAWRIEYEGALYHILSRGNERSDIFKDDQDRSMFLDLLGKMAERFEMDVAAYVLMNNHYHLLLRTNRANLSKSMQWLGVTYTRRFNIRHRRSGHLFQGRFKSILVENDAYLFQLSYYIHRNPLRAGLVKRLADYEWSSYRSYAYGIKYERWLCMDLVLAQLENHPDPYKAYKDNMQAYAEEEQSPWEDLRYGLILGSKRFSQKIRQRYLPETPHVEMPQQKRLRDDSNIATILTRAAKELGCDVQRYRQAKRLSGADAVNRDILIYILYQQGFWSNQQIADMFDITYFSVSRRVQFLTEKMRKDKTLAAHVNEINAKIKM